jgi:hypothetical protein
VKQFVPSEIYSTRRRESWKRVVDEIKFLEEEVNYCFMRRILQKQVTMEDKFDALAGRDLLPTAVGNTEGPTTPGQIMALEPVLETNQRFSVDEYYSQRSQETDPERDSPMELGVSSVSVPQRKPMLTCRQTKMNFPSVLSQSMILNKATNCPI